MTVASSCLFCPVCLKGFRCVKRENNGTLEGRMDGLYIVDDSEIP